MSVFSSRRQGRPAIVGHRGAPVEASQNTHASFAAAAAAGADWVELDARRSADGRVVVVHDPVTPDGVPVVARGAAELATRGVHELGEVLDGLPPGLGVDVELKNLPGEPDHDEQEGLAGLVAEEVGRHRGSRPFLLSSFNPMTAVACAAALPDVPAGLVTGAGTSLATGAEIAAELGLSVVCPSVHAKGLDAATVAEAHARGLAVMVWTVEDASLARRLAAAGVDALCTDDPRSLVAVLGAVAGR